MRLTHPYPKVASMRFPGVEKKKYVFSFLTKTGTYVSGFGSALLRCVNALLCRGVSGRALTIFCLLFLWGSSSQAHQLSTSFLTGDLVESGAFVGEWQVRLYDLEQVLGLDSNGDGKLLWGELQRQASAVNAYLTQHLQLSRAESLCTTLLDDRWQIDSHFNEAYLAVPLHAQCPLAGDLSVAYSAFFDIDSQHKLLLSITTLPSPQGDNSAPSSAIAQQRIISDSQRAITFASADGSTWDAFKEFTVQGVIHIWIGFDHILFLISLILTCVLTRQHKQWVGNNNIRQIISSTTWIITAFTIAHSLTLSATAMGWITLPSRWVEATIAISVVVAAINNIFPLVLRLGWLAFGFGLIHGMGFAGVLGELGLPSDQKLTTILAFNIGVELGQLAIVLLVLPLLVLVRNSVWYSRYSVVGVSIIISLIATQWLVQRLG